MNATEAIVLGLVQGLTEFLPISSSGHLVIAKHLMQTDVESGGPVIELIAHLGTLLAVVLFFRKQVAAILTHALWGGWRETRLHGIRTAWWEDEDGRMISAIAIVTLITMIVGLLFKDFFEDAYNSVRTAGIGLLITSALLMLAVRLRNREGRHALPDARIALGVGLAQGLAILPGLSRSGSTIVAGLAMGLRREMAFAFSFLISVPAILGASVLEMVGAPAKDLPSIGSGILLFSTSMLAGFATLVLLRALVKQGNFGWFALYVLPLGIWATFFL